MSVDFSLIHLYSVRLVYLTQVLSETQRLGSGEGDIDEPWGEQFQRAAAEEYERQLPRSYLESRCMSFRACQEQMERLRPDPIELTNSWILVESYLRNLAAAIEDRLNVDKRSERGAVVGETPTTPATVHFEVLAPTVTSAGLATQLRAAKAVADFSLRQQHGGVTEEEISWIRDLSNERSVLTIATKSGHSERSMHRLLKELWSKMGVNGRTGAIVVAASNGWLSRPEVPPSLVPDPPQGD